MAKFFQKARFTCVVIGLAAPYAFPAVAEDLGTTPDDQVSLQLAEGVVRPSDPHLIQGNLYVCPAAEVGDTAGAIDCDVNKALSAQSHSAR